MTEPITDGQPVVRVGDRVEMRKPHPCGGREWNVYRIGADFGIRCITCGRHVLLDRVTFYRRLKRVLPDEDRASGR